MRILNLVQGTQEWKQTRWDHPTASEASSMMGASKNSSRTDLIRIKATGDEQEFSQWVEEVLFARGHEVEEKGRSLAEIIIGEDLYPVTATDDDGYLLASFDGVTMGEDVIFECKQWNQAKADFVTENDSVPEEDRWQVIQQLVVSRAQYCLYMVTDGTEKNTVTCAYTLQDGDEERLMAGWKQFEEDVANYQHVEPKELPVGKAPSQLPALDIQVTGMVTHSNLREFKETAMAIIGEINTTLKTDEDFANAEKTVKWCEGVESRLKAAEDHVLSQAESIYESLNTLRGVGEDVRQTRLKLGRAIDDQKKLRRAEILNEGNEAFDAHIAKINETLGGKIKLPVIPVDFAGAMKGKRTLNTLRSAASDELARAKIEASQLADTIRVNLETLRGHTEGYAFLFHDAQQLVLKDNEDLRNLIKTRISEHKAEQDRIAAENLRLAEEKLRQEEAAAQAKTELAPESVANQSPLMADKQATPAQESPKQNVGVWKRARPTDFDIIKVLALHYRVHEQVVIGWLGDMDLKEASQKIAV